MASPQIMRAYEDSASDPRFSDFRFSDLFRISDFGVRSSLALSTFIFAASASAATSAPDSIHQSTNPSLQYSSTPTPHHPAAPEPPPPATPREFFNAGTQR